ncbi:U3 small nucleolar ribonucleo protein complex, subunit Mpp10 [Protomyces lactucae-debilis]|uniref:U3 small nucleolar ribonucleoprotein protein MPP10 n=1 Tax=Protomyces lactucae-debilis TaxID=2754530 RepID=A0A1Y2FHK7_PROLT|nr:U3 small nucleolar ribonucleoprotein complex, subunit Mpp10 [Protomyces lactucae-debilis]ORY83087.1 U3 small nucleolar ribonucleo protein complex, subunit Mpp10 [Protomyces lactucae-debilis]
MVAAHTASEEFLISTIQDSPEAFLHPTDTLYKAALVLSKRFVDPLAKQHSVFDEVHIQDLHVDQIWQQIKAISESVVDQVLDADLPGSEEAQASQEDESDLDIDEEDGLELGSEMEMEEDLESGDEMNEDAEELGESQDEIEEAEDDEGAQEAQQDVFGLNDQFFDIDDFNRQTEVMDANYEAAQSEDDIDYNADPDEASDMEDLEQEADMADNANEIRYEDFFAPPKRVYGASTGRKKRVRKDRDEEANEAEPAESTMARMQKDLFADDDAAMAEQEKETDQGQRLSAYAKRQLKLKKEIEQLEMENVGKKDWTLMGETSAKARPKDALLEETMDFERTSKPVPVITEEVTASLEDMIKARIVARQFDTVIRKIPESAHKFAKNTFELDDSKPQQSLAEVYEQEIQKRADPTGFKSAKDIKLEKQQAEIEELFKDVCYNLDALSSWHYTPKPVTESLQIVTNAPAIEMEDAQPLTLSSRARLAPQEQYGVSAEKGEVVGKAGLPMSKAEMTSEERQRHRRRQRATAKKSGAQKQGQEKVSKRTAEKQSVLETLKQGDVKVISGGKARSIQTGKQGKSARNLATIKL